MTPGWSLFSLYKMNKILLSGPKTAWGEDTEPGLPLPHSLSWKVPKRRHLTPQVQHPFSSFLFRLSRATDRRQLLLIQAT